MTSCVYSSSSSSWSILPLKLYKLLFDTFSFNIGVNSFTDLSFDDLASSLFFDTTIFLILFWPSMIQVGSPSLKISPIYNSFISLLCEPNDWESSSMSSRLQVGLLVTSTYGSYLRFEGLRVSSMACLQSQKKFSSIDAALFTCLNWYPLAFLIESGD